MPVKKSPSPATQLTLEGTPSRPGGSKGAPKKAAAPKGRGARSAVAPRKKRSPAAGDTVQQTALTDAVRALEQVAESLHFTHESFAQSLLRLPRAEDYDPLTDALRRLATAPPSRDQETSATARSAVRAAREHLEEALRTLPGAADYEPAARNLRAMASVSPSLLEWLREVPALATPLGESVAGLREAILELDRALEAMGDEPVPGASRVKVVVRG